jgi:O-antigen biosynthesis protein
LANNNLVPHIDINDFDREMIEKMQQDKDIDTLQFVVKAFPCTVEERLANLQNRYGNLLQESQTTQSELEQSHNTIDQLQSELEQSHNTIDQLQSELEQSHNTIDQLQSELEQSHNTIDQLQSGLQHNLEQANTTIQWMETSKFWLLRSKWLKLKLLFKLNR